MIPQWIVVQLGVQRSVDRALEGVRILLNPAAACVFQLHHPGQFLCVDPRFIMDVSVGIGEGHHFTAQLIHFFHRELRHITASGYQTGFSLQRLPSR